MEKKRLLDKKTGMLLGLLGLLLVSGYVNYRMGPADAQLDAQVPVVRIEGARPSPAPTIAEQADAFSAYQTERGEMRAQEIAMLEEIIRDEKSGKDVIAQAQAQKLALISSMEQETNLESLIRAKGFSQVMASAKPGNITIVVGPGALTDAQAIQILDIATRETGEKAENIKIIQTK